jgi:predicted transcriptional regulator
MTQQKTSKIALRVEPELRDRLEAAAELDRRPTANLIRAVLADWIERQAQGERTVWR